MQIEAAVLRRPGQDFTIEKLRLQQPGEGEVLVEIAGVGLCHTDLVFSGGLRPYPVPAVLGHEGSGKVISVGPGVSGFVPGDAVIIGFSSCGECRNCHDDYPSYCRDFMSLNFRGGRSDGSSALSSGDEAVASHFFGQSSFASHALTRAINLVRVPETAVPLAWLGPLGCGIQTGAGAVLRAMSCRAGSSLVVIGGGPVGLSAIMAAPLRDCSDIVLVEPMAARRKLALELGATAVIDPMAGNIVSQIRELLPDGTDYLLDSTGKAEVISHGIQALALRGTLGLVGLPHDPNAKLEANIGLTMRHGQRVLGILEGDSDQQTFIPELLGYHRAGRFPFDRLISTYPLASINEAVAEQARGECVKAVLIP